MSAAETVTDTPAEPPESTPPPETPPAATVPASQWATIVASIDEQLSGEKYLEQFKDKPDAIEALVTDAVTANRLIGAEDRIARPAADAPQADWDKFYSKLGRPDEATGYDLSEFTPTEGMPWDESLQEKMLGVMHEAGATQAQVRKILDGFNEAQASMWNSSQAALTDSRQAAETELRTEWGADYDARAELAGRALLHGAEDPAALESLVLQDGTPFGNHPLALKIFAKLGMAMSEDKFRDGRGPANLGLTPESAEAKIKELEANRDFVEANLDKNHPEHAKYRAEWNRLYAIANPEG